MPSRRPVVLLVMLISACGAVALSQQPPVAKQQPPPPPARTHDITIDDYLTVHQLTDCVASPDGRHVAYCEMRWGEHDEPRFTNIWVANTQGGRPVRLTFENTSDSSPRWSADSRRIFFLGKRTRAGERKPPYDGARQVWAIGLEPGELQPGEPQPVTRVPGGIEAFELARDGRTLYFTRAGAEADREWKELRKKYANINFTPAVVKYTELWKLDLENWRQEQVAAPRRVILEFEVAPDGTRVALITSPDDRLISKEGQSRVDVFDVATGELRTLPDKLYRGLDVPSPYGWVENLAWSDDGRALAWTVDFDGYPGEILVAEWADLEVQDIVDRTVKAMVEVHDRAAQWGTPQSTQPAEAPAETPVDTSANVWRLTRPEQMTCGGRLMWRPKSRDLCLIGEQRARRGVVCISKVEGGRQGEHTLLTPGDIVTFFYSFPADGQHVAVARGDTQDAVNVYWYDIAGFSAGAQNQLAALPKRLTDINPQIDSWKLPQISLVQWKAPDGAGVEGVLELPPDWKPGDPPLPLVVECHGGPSDATLLYLQYWIYGRTLFPALGYALLSPNYRGSTGYGDKFLVDLVGRENDIEVQDILAGVDALIERKIADPERLGVMGWSNGGFLVNGLITQTQRFKAASSGAGVVDQLIQWGAEDTPGHVVNFMRGLPWERTEAYIKASPIYRLGAANTPTIIHVGEEDERVPAAHSRALFRALYDYRKVPAVLLTYPGAGHGLAISDHRKGKLEWDVKWFEKYLPVKASGATKQAD